jgi:hypothetical protein
MSVINVFGRRVQNRRGAREGSPELGAAEKALRELDQKEDRHALRRAIKANKARNAKVKAKRYEARAERAAAGGKLAPHSGAGNPSASATPPPPIATPSPPKKPRAFARKSIPGKAPRPDLEELEESKSDAEATEDEDAGDEASDDGGESDDEEETSLSKGVRRYLGGDQNFDSKGYWVGGGRLTARWATRKGATGPSAAAAGSKRARASSAKKKGTLGPAKAKAGSAGPAAKKAKGSSKKVAPRK